MPDFSQKFRPKSNTWYTLYSTHIYWDSRYKTLCKLETQKCVTGRALTREIQSPLTQNLIIDGNWGEKHTHIHTHVRKHAHARAHAPFLWGLGSDSVYLYIG